MPLPYTAPPAVYQQYQQATQAAFVPPQQPTFLIVLPQQPSHAPPSFVPPHYVPAHASAVALVPTEVTSNEPAKMKDAKKHPESTAKRTKGDSRTRAWKLKYWCKMCGEPRSHTYHYRVATKQDAGPAICKRCQAEGTVTETILSCASVSGKSDGSHKGRRVRERQR